MEGKILNQLLKRKIIPVVVIEDPKHALPLVNAFLEGGIDIIEVTLRTDAALTAISTIHKSFPEIILGAGTLTTIDQAKKAKDAGIMFAVAPGLNPKIVNFFKETEIAFVPGVMTPSEIDLGVSLGCPLLKFFPAHQIGGVKALKALSEPFLHNNISFCPTGGINLYNMNDYLALPNVFAVGGSWIASKEQIKTQSWTTIKQQAKDAILRCQKIF